MLLKNDITEIEAETDSEYDEAETIRKAANGDSQAFTALVKQYEKLVYNLAYQTAMNPDDAFDISQEVFIKAYRSLQSFRGDCKFSTWIYRIAQNAAKDFMRSKSRRRTVSLTDYGNDEDGEAKTADIADDNISSKPEESAEANERREIVRQAIASLSEDHRRIILLRDIEGYSYEDISKMLGLEIGTVKSRLNRARMAIKEYLLKRNIL
nr:sigma-70 family RNA polymerase sigma factor [Clostridia bacterium]